MDAMNTDAAETPPPFLVDETRVSDELICGICFGVPSGLPVITPCEHIFCRECLKEAMQRNQCCPNDRLPISRADVKPLQKGKLLWRIWANIQVRCGNCEVGCGWKGAIADYEKHAEFCPGALLADENRGLLANECINLRKELRLLDAENKKLKEEKDAECTKLKNEYRLLATQNAQLKEEKSALKKLKKERRRLVEENAKLKMEKNTLQDALSRVTADRTRE